MAAQWVEIIRIGGAAARHVADQFSRWAATRTTDDPNEWGDEQWPASVHEEVERFVAVIREHASTPPVLYYCRYTDLWSMGDVFDRSYLPRPTMVFTKRMEVHCRDLSTARGAIQSSLTKHLRTKRYPAESYLFLRQMREAVEAWDALDPDSVIVTVREVFRGLYEDREIEASLRERPPWLDPE